MSCKMPLFEGQLLIRKFHRRRFPPKTLKVTQGLVYAIWYYFSCRIVFVNPIQKTLRNVSVYTKGGAELWEQCVSDSCRAV